MLAAKIIIPSGRVNTARANRMDEIVLFLKVCLKSYKQADKIKKVNKCVSSPPVIHTANGAQVATSKAGKNENNEGFVDNSVEILNMHKIFRIPKIIPNPFAALTMSNPVFAKRLNIITHKKLV